MLKKNNGNIYQTSKYLEIPMLLLFNWHIEDQKIFQKELSTRKSQVLFFEEYDMVFSTEPFDT